jgi:hypothetical protein
MLLASSSPGSWDLLMTHGTTTRSSLERAGEDTNPVRALATTKSREREDGFNSSTANASTREARWMKSECAAVTTSRRASANASQRQARVLGTTDDTWRARSEAHKSDDSRIGKKALANSMNTTTVARADTDRTTTAGEIRARENSARRKTPAGRAGNTDEHAGSSRDRAKAELGD